MLVAMSGGVDSALACVLLHAAGYEVIGVTMKTWDYALAGRPGKKETGCCSLGSINDARQVAVSLGVPHYVLDIRGDFKTSVIDYFIHEYTEGRTPNPCVVCNTRIKWDLLFEKADQLHCDWVATGHYAQIGRKNDRYWISKAHDLRKDQSYALWGITQERLARTLFPLGARKKSDIKEMARRCGFDYLLKKSESYEICFIPDHDYRSFLRRHATNKRGLTPGAFVDTDGAVLGEHKGYALYTIGQRRGLGVTLGYPVYVVDIKKELNQVVLGRLDALERQGMYVDRLNPMKYEDLASCSAPVHAKIRYNHEGTPSVLAREGDGLNVFFPDGVHAITPGQAAVFYEAQDVIGGGWIQSSFQKVPPPRRVYSGTQPVGS